MRSNDRERRASDEVGYIVGAAVLSGILIWGYPQVGIGIAVGTLCAIPTLSRLACGAADREEWRSRAVWIAVSGVVVALAYFLLGGSVGADVEARRFDRNWSLRDTDWGVFVEYPWAWIPVAAATALVGFAALSYWAARDR